MLKHNKKKRLFIQPDEENPVDLTDLDIRKVSLNKNRESIQFQGICRRIFVSQGVTMKKKNFG